jgi:hypothetical protein
VERKIEYGRHGILREVQGEARNQGCAPGNNEKRSRRFTGSMPGMWHEIESHFALKRDQEIILPIQQESTARVNTRVVLSC